MQGRTAGEVRAELGRGEPRTEILLTGSWENWKLGDRKGKVGWEPKGARRQS